MNTNLTVFSITKNDAEKYIENILQGKVSIQEEQYFLIQVTKFGSTNILTEGFYQHEGWQETPRDADHGKVKVGDLLLVYFGSTAKDFQKTLKMIYKVESVTEDNVKFYIKSWRKLTGITREQINDSVKDGTLGESFNKLSQQGFNIIQISKSDFDAILELGGEDIEVNIDDERFKSAHKLFEEDMLSKSGGVPFENFEHPQLVKGEISYKREILEKTKHLRSINNWKSWKKSGEILSQLKEACSQKICQNLLVGDQYGKQNSSAASLYLVPEKLQDEYCERLYSFFTSASSETNEFAENFDKLIEFLQTNNLKIDWRFITYLAFNANPEKYFEVPTKKFEKLLQYYGVPIKLRASYTWKLYSIVLKAAEILRTKLSNYGEIDYVQLHSYMWVVSSLIPDSFIDEKPLEEILQKANQDFDEYLDILDRKKQLIFYGPPGTGKTFTAKILADYVTKDNSSKPTLTFRSAAIKILNDEKREMNYNEITKLAFERNLLQTSGETPEFTLLKEMSGDIQKNGASSVFKKVRKGVYTLNPEIELDEEIKSAEKSSVANHQFVRNVTFHQSYSYEEFIEGIKPGSVDGKVVYSIEPGIFRIICEDAAADPGNKYVILIDEINRGNISKILGELITLIEKDKRVNHKLQLAYSKELFAVPDNVYIIGTMNTADRSLIQIDAALRRRFAFYELMPKPEILTQTIEGVSLKKLLEELNKRIIEADLREKQIGHSYLMEVEKLEDLQFVFAYEIIPLLQDYFFNDYKKLMEDILSEQFVDPEKKIITDDWKKNPQTFLNYLKSTFSL